MTASDPTRLGGHPAPAADPADMPTPPSGPAPGGDPTAPSTAPQPAPLDLDAIEARIEKAHDHIAKLCSGEERWTMRIPAQPGRDSDLVISAAVEDAGDLVAEVRRLRAELDAAPAVPRTYQLPAEPPPEVTKVWDSNGDQWCRLTPNLPGDVNWVPADTVADEVHVTEAAIYWEELLLDHGPLSTAPPAGTDGAGAYDSHAVQDAIRDEVRRAE